ncbi:MAG: tRNA pseudouridine(55) synthase TruB [Clostridia bacterium]
MSISGILNINKPKGITSHDVVDIIKKIYKTKVGHTGTLDPMATGVLPICLGTATKLSLDITSYDKIYFVTMLLGIRTDSYDITGNITEVGTVCKDKIYIKQRIKKFIGKQKQTPPIYSAIKINGKKAYEYARKNIDVKLKSRDIEIYNIYDINIDLIKNLVTFKVHCSKGTYIRSLVDDIGKSIGCFATMTDLVRTYSSNLNIEDSINLEELLKLKDIDSEVISIEKYFDNKRNVYLNEIDITKFLNGVILDYNSIDNLVKVYCNKKYIGIGKIKDNTLKRYVVEDI